MNNLHEQGRAHYKRGDYRKAIEIFDRAIGRAPYVQLLDNRAACYEKLNELSAALQDAKKTIQQHREDATGYLRAGKLLMKMDKPGVALDIYTHGLKCIKHVGQGYELLKKVHKEVLDIVSPPKSVDPLTVLPRELAETVLAYLSFRDCMNACLVTRGWAQFIRTSPNLWSHLDLSGARKKVRTAFVSRAINVGRSRLRQATLNMLYDFDKTIVALVKHCPLEELTLFQLPLQGASLPDDLKNSAMNLKSLKLKADLHVHSIRPEDLLHAVSDRIETFWATRSGLFHWDSVVYSRLAEFNVAFSDGGSFLGCLMNVPELMPNIRSLTIRHENYQTILTGSRPIDLSSCTELSHLDINGNLEDLDCLILPPSIVTLKLAHGFKINRRPSFRFVFNHANVHDLPRLEEISLSASGIVDHQSVRSLLERHENKIQVSASPEGRSMLRTFNLRSGTVQEIPIVEMLSHPRLRDLENLSFVSCFGVDDKVVSEIMEKLPKLRSLDLTGSDVTGVGVKEAAKAKCLQHLVLNNCRSVSRDAVDWAREKGFRVDYKMTSETGGGSKVRY